MTGVPAISFESRPDHIGIKVDDLEAATRFLGEAFSLIVASTTSIPERGVSAAFLRWGDVDVELFEVTAPDGPPSGIHHLAIEVRDLDASIEHLRGLGVATATPEPIVQAGRRTIFLNRTTTQGIAFQLLEAESS